MKPSLFEDNMIICVENLKEPTIKVLTLSESGKVSGYKINIQSMVFLYTSNEHMDIKLKNIIPCPSLKKKKKKKLNTWM